MQEFTTPEKREIAAAAIQDAVTRHGQQWLSEVDQGTLKTYDAATARLKALCDRAGIPFWDAATFPTDNKKKAKEQSPAQFNHAHHLSERSVVTARDMQGARLAWADARVALEQSLAGALEKGDSSLGQTSLGPDVASTLAARIAQRLVPEQAVRVAGVALPVGVADAGSAQTAGRTTRPVPPRGSAPA